MTYSLDTLNSRNSPAPGAPSGIKRFAHEVSLILGLLGLIFWLFCAKMVDWLSLSSALFVSFAMAVFIVLIAAS